MVSLDFNFVIVSFWCCGSYAHFMRWTIIFMGDYTFYGHRRSGWGKARSKFQILFRPFPQTFVVWTLSLSFQVFPQTLLFIFSGRFPRHSLCELYLSQRECVCVSTLREIKVDTSTSSSGRSQWSVLASSWRKVNYKCRSKEFVLKSFDAQTVYREFYPPQCQSHFPFSGPAPNFCQWSFNLSKAAQFENKMWNNLCRKRNFRYEEG